MMFVVIELEANAGFISEVHLHVVDVEIQT